MLWCALMAMAASKVFGADGEEIAKRPWYEAQSAHFNIYTCGTRQEVFQLAARLEQFRGAYGLLAGAQAVASPPIVVMAFPDQKELDPFLPQYQGKPANLSGFFTRQSDENLIVLALSGTNRGSMQTIFHEYSHLLFRHNDHVWPLWLQEGMAEMYSTFEASGRSVRIGHPLRHHIYLLEHSELMPLKELLAVEHDSPQYNESERQGVFYAESWLLTHYLMNGDNAVLKARFGQYTKLLREGQDTEAAFTNALGVSLKALEGGLKRYLARGQFEPVNYIVSADLSAPHVVTTHSLTPVETCYWLGNELMRIRRPDAAEPFFDRGKKIAPMSPLPYEGLGLLAAQRDQNQQAEQQFQMALKLGSTNYLAHYFYAKETFKNTGDGSDRYTHIAVTSLALDIRHHYEKAIELMPSFAPAHEGLGFFELVQGENPAVAREHLEKAVLLEPENQWYLLPLAEAEAMNQDIAGARRTLQPLREPRVDEKLRALAEETLKEIEKAAKGR